MGALASFIEKAMPLSSAPFTLIRSVARQFSGKAGQILNQDATYCATLIHFQDGNSGELRHGAGT